MQMEYDARGNVTEYIDGRKTKFVREYTKTDLLKSEKAFDVRENDSYETTETASRSYAYDEGGILKQVTEGSSSIFYNEKDGSYQADAYGNIRSMKWSSTGFEMNYEYDNLNRMTNVKTPDGKDVVYAYNQNNQVTKFGDVSITYSKSRISEYTLLNGIKKSFEYNDLFLLAQETGKYHVFSFDIEGSKKMDSKTRYDAQLKLIRLMKSIYAVIEEIQEKTGRKILVFEEGFNTYDEGLPLYEFGMKQEPYFFGDTFGFTIYRDSLDKDTILWIYEYFRNSLNIDFNMHLADGYYETNNYVEGKDIWKSKSDVSE